MSMRSEIDNLIHELGTEKVSIKQKAFSKLYDILQCRLTDIQKVLDNGEAGLDWESLFRSVDVGIRGHARKLMSANTDLLENDTKITNFSKVIITLCECPGKNSRGIPSSVLVTKVSEMLSDEAGVKFFGKCYLQVLQKHILKPTSDLTRVELDVWRDIVSVLFKLMKSKRTKIAFLDIVYCTKHVIELGCAFSHLAIDLHPLLPHLELLLEKRTDPREKLELLIIAYHCCRNIAIEHRFEVCRFTEVISKYIHQIFATSLNDESKEVLFKLMDLAVIVHYPSISVDRSYLECVHDKPTWRAQLRNFAYIVDLETKPAAKSVYKGLAKVEVNQVFVQFAARLCFLVYWDDSIWEESTDETEGNAPKRPRRASKMQALISHATPESGEFNWKWLSVIAEIMFSYPSALEQDDYQSLLQMLSQCQHTMELDYQVYAFAKCCYVLLEREENLLIGLNAIIAKLCGDLWHKISEGAARVCTMNNKHSLESHALLQILIHYNKAPSSSFIEDVTKLFLNKSAVKSDSTLRTLITLMTRYNLDTLPNGKDLAVKILHYTFEKETLAKSNLRQIIKTDKPSAQVLARVGVVCCLSKTDVVKFFKAQKIDGEKFFAMNWNLQQQKLYKREVQKVIELILLRSNERLLIEDPDFIRGGGTTTEHERNAEFPKEIKCIVEQSYEEVFPQILDFKSKIVNEDDNFEMVREYLERVLENNELMLNLANDFLSLEAFNEEKFAASFLVKKIDYHMQEIEQLFGLLLKKTGDHGMQDINRLLLMVKSLFSSNFHPKLCLKIRSYELESCLKWVAKQVKHKFIDKYDDFFLRIGEAGFTNAKMEHKLKFLAIETLCEYNNFEGASTEAMIDLLDGVELDSEDNMDIHTVFHVLKLFGRQPKVSKDIVEWIWPYVIDICKSYHTNQYISGRMVGVLKDVVNLSKDHRDLDPNVLSLFRSFGTVCARPEYNPEVTISFLRQFCVFHQNYFHLYFDNETVVGIYKFIYDRFLNSSLLAIKMEAIKTVCFILHSDIEQDVLLSDRDSQKKISEIIFRKHNIDYTSEDMETEDVNQDEKANKIAAHLQLYTSVFCVNFLFRKPIILEISKVVLHFKLPEAVALKLFNKILKFLDCAPDSLMDSNSIVHFSSQWIRLGYPFFKFPWYFCGCKSFEEFVQDNYELVLVAILKNTCRETEQFAKQTELSPKKMIENVLPSCFSFLIPIKAGCSGISYEVKANEMSDKINAYHSAEEQRTNLLKHMPSVIGNVLENLYDCQKFKEFCGFDFEVRVTNETISFESFEKCLIHLKTNYPGAGSSSLLTFFCATPKFGNSIEKLLTIQKKKIQSTSLKEHKLLYLLQYCVLVEKLLEYLTCATVSVASSIKGFIVRETTSFLCFLLLDEKYGMRLRETSVNFLSTLLRKILPVCSEDVKPFLNKIVSSLVTICKQLRNSKTMELYKTSFATIKFLIFDHQKNLSGEIANLDEFPDTIEFAELRQSQLEIKYKNGDFTLVQEIEHFLEIKKRKVEGLTALCSQLASKKSELKLLFNELGDSLGFSEEGEKSLLHKLIRSLIDYARNNFDDEERAVTAIKCLGEIGNNDLVTMVFQTEDHQAMTIYDTIENVAKCQKMICTQALDQMDTMILHHNPRIFEDASRACYYMMESVSSQGYEASVYLRPFKTGMTSPRTLFYESPKDGKKLDFMETMRREEYSTYKTWIKRITGSIMLFCGDKVLEKVSTAQRSFAELMTPLLMQLLLSYNSTTVNEEIMTGINFFFSQSAEKLDYLNANEASIFVNKQAIKQMLKLVECLRMHSQTHQKSKLSQNLKLDYLNIAKAAKHCEAFFTAMLYCEKWAEERMLTESVACSTSINDPILQNIMYNSFKAIGIKDASDLFVNPLTNRSLYLQISNQNWQNILEHDAAGRSDECLKLMSDTRLNFLASKMAPADQKKNYESLWRLADWDVLVPCDPEIRDAKVVVDYRDEFEKFHYSALKCLKNGDELGQKQTVLKARKAIQHLLQQESLECTQNLYKFLGMSHMLQQIEDFADIRFYRPTGSSDKLLQKWNSQNQLPHDFKLIEPILAQRNSVLDTANIRAGRRRWVPGALEENLLYTVKEAIEAGCTNEALVNLVKMRELTNLTATSKAEMLILEAQLSSATNIGLAKHCLKRVIEDPEFVREFPLRSTAYRMYGQILADNHADEIKSIDKNYFKLSIKYLTEYAKHNNKGHLVAELVSQELSQDSQSPLSQHDTEDAIDKKIKSNVCVYETIAQYYDRDFISKSEHIDSPDFQNKLKAKETNQKKFDELEKVIKKSGGTQDMKRSYIIYKRSLEIDKKEIESALHARKVAAGIALFYYMTSSKNDPGDNAVCIFRIVSIWLAYMDSTTTIKVLRDGLGNIPTYKFVVALPQLVVRLGDDTQDLLKVLIEKCAVDHPYHTLPLVLALVNSYADADRQPDKEEPRVFAAKNLWSSFKKNKKISGQTIQQLEKMSTGLIELANTQPKQHNLGVLRNLDRIQCPTMELPVMKDCRYESSLTSVVGWSAKLENPGGINAPKKIYCKCSDGVTRPQLLKGKDDMRQDAVMQQVFGVVNQLLKNNKETQKRHARVRTYKVVPLARRSGILEWCDNTIPIGIYLAPQGRDLIGAHEKYFPKDLRPFECMKKLAEGDRGDVDAKKSNFKKILDKTHPAFQFFFYENYKNPGQWFERRLAYTTSVAVSSMVGYILGIGDRHVQNILIDYNTAEVIHIDFGIAFEQGRILPHPELIPFRLTRDIVAPMGVCGVDGVFRKACEKTMKILRDNEKTLVTILEILLYDPMYAWTLTTSQARRHQLDDEDSGEGDEDTPENSQKDSMASRALLRVKAKLKGQADDSSGYSSVEGQVECLIQKAMNPSLLSQLFKGWQAYL